MHKENELAQKSLTFFHKYRNHLPNTIYYKDWKDAVAIPNYKTIETIQGKLHDKDKRNLCIAEIGIGMGATSYHIANFLNNEGAFYLFDYTESIIPIKKFLNLEGFNNVRAYGSSFKKLDSYNWNLLYLLKKEKTPLFDYVFLDGAHSFPVDGLAFFLVDMLLKDGGFIDFDDYEWTHSGHIQENKDKYAGESQDSEHGTFLDWIYEAFTPQQIEMPQVAAIVDAIVMRTGRYKEVVPHKVYQKIA